MTSGLQNRLIGTIIVVALAVIFLPDFLDGKKAPKQEEFASVPATPARKPIVDPEPFPSERVASAARRPVEIVDEQPLDDQDSSAAQGNEAQPPSRQNDLASQTIVEKPQPADDDAGWVIQLGSFRHEKNVKQLLEKLEDAGYRAFSRPIRTNSGPLNKVFVGPDLQKSKLDAALPHLQELTGLRGKVTTFKVE